MAAAKNIQLSIENDGDVEIKVTRFEYMDEGDWQTENWFGVDGHQKMDPHRSITLNRRNLGGVGGSEGSLVGTVFGETTRFRLAYREYIGGVKWTPDRYATSEEFRIYDNASFTMSIPSGALSS